MWINSPLGEWEQNARVEMALGAAERGRMLEEAQVDNAEAGSSDLLYRVKSKLAWRANLVSRAVNIVGRSS